jgi:hypothetical protein
MAIDFPSSPALNDTYTEAGKTWVWNGGGWIVQPITLTSGAITAALGYTPLSVSGGTLQGNIDNTATGYFDLPSGTTAQRPGSPNTGMIRYNTTLGCIETYVQSIWQVVANTTLDYGLITSAADTTFDYGALS